MADVNSGFRTTVVLTLAASGWFACSTGDHPKGLPDEGVAVTTTHEALDPTWTPRKPRKPDNGDALVAWYTALNGTTVNVDPSSTAVNRWPDQSNTHNYDVIQQNTPNKPTFNANGWAPQKGLLNFNGNQFLRLDTWPATPAGTDAAFTVLAVVRPAVPTVPGDPAATIDRQLAAWWDPNGNGLAWTGFHFADHRTLPDMGRTYSVSPTQTFNWPHDVTGITAGPGVMHAIAWRYDPGSHFMKITVDGTTWPSSKLPTLDPLPQMPLIIGAGSLLPNRMFQGDLAELAIYSEPLSDDDIANFEAYAQTTWGNLPTQTSLDPCVDVNNQPILPPTDARIRCDDLTGSTYGDHCSSGVCVGTTPPAGSPADLSATAAWYHAGDAETTRRDNGIETWFDRTSNHLDLRQGFYFTRPSWNASGWVSTVGTKETLTFAGHHAMSRGSWLGAPSGADAEFSVLAVLQTPNTAQSAGVAAWWSAVGLGRVACDLKTSSNSTVLDLFRTDAGNATEDFTGSTAVPSGKHVIVWRYSPGLMRLTIDGTTVPSSSVTPIGALNPELFMVGADSGVANTLLNADVAELSLIGRAINDAELSNFDTYAQNEWGGLTLCAASCVGKGCGADNGCGGTCDCGTPCTTNADCGVGLICSNNQCKTPGGDPGTQCTTDAECGPGLHCGSGGCGGAGAACSSVCAPGLTCSGGTCVTCASPCANVACGGLDACGGTCPCGTKQTGESCFVHADCANGAACDNGICGPPGDIGSTCEIAADCQEGLICYKNTCIADGCLTNPAALGCGTPDSECANWCTPHPICTADADCPAGYHCPPDNGAAYGVPGLRVCELPACATDPQSVGCGYALAECGRCHCETQCQNKHCGDADLSDGCGSRCNGVCEVGQTGCTSDADCHDGVCRAGQCRPKDPCASFNIPAADCGPGDTLCGPCPTLDSSTRGSWGDTSSRQCGIDPNTLENLGPCGAATEKCTGDGRCVPIVDTPAIRVADAGGGTRDVVPQPSPPAAPIGAIAGSFSVSDRGSATYSIPIEVAPGGSVMPSLVLRYMSTSGNGAMGAGWSLDGLSEITRCARTFAEDAISQPVLGTADDVFCMDGHRLEQIPSTENRFEYRTTIETFTKVVGVGDGSVPDYFMAYTRDGRILTYGKFAASLFSDGTTTAAASWELTRVEDRMRNFMTIDYYTMNTSDPVTGRGSTSEVVPTQISYTGQQETQAGDRIIKFNYQGGRDDSIVGWRPPFSRMFTRSTRLNSIEVTAAGVTVRRYVFTYKTVRGTTLLSSLQECGGESGACKPATTFDYYDEYGFQDAQVAQLKDQSLGSDPKILKAIGQYGITRRQGGSDRIATATNRSYITRVSPYFDVAAFAASFIPDYGALASTILEYAGSGLDKEHRNFIPFDLSVGTNTIYTQLPTPCPRDFTPTAVPFEADPLSSGRDEAIQYWCPKDTGTGRRVAGGAAGTLQDVWVLPQIWYTDVNGDGLPDKLSCQWNGGRGQPDEIHLDLATAANGVPEPGDSHYDLPIIPAFAQMCDITAGCVGSEQTCAFDPPFTTLLDVNGDGTDELVVYDHHVLSNNGFAALIFDQNHVGTWHQEYFSDVQLEYPDPEDYEFVTMDANGDGLRDLLVLAPRDKPDYPAWVLYNTGHGFRQVSLTPDPAYSNLAGHNYVTTAAAFPPFVVDYDHDGVDDFLEPNADDNGVPWRVRHIKNGVVTIETVPSLKAGPGTIGDFNGDGVLDAWTHASGMADGEYRLSYGVGRHDHLLKSVTDGLGRSVSVEYDGKYTGDQTDDLLSNELTPIAEVTTGAPTWPTGWPLRISSAGTDHPVVSRHTEGIFRDSNSKVPDLDREVDYAYGNWANDVAGYGALGFNSRLVVERDGSGVERRRTYYHYDTSSPTLPTSKYTRPLTGLLKKMVEIFPEEDNPAAWTAYRRRTDTTFDWELKTSLTGEQYPYLAIKTTTTGILDSYDIEHNNGPPTTVDTMNPVLQTRVEQYFLDDYGNVQDTTITAKDLAAVSIHRDFTPTDAQARDWLISLPNSEKISSTYPNCGSDCESSRRTRYQEFTYYDGTNLLRTVHRAPGQPTYDRETTIIRDPVGNPWQIFVKDMDTGEERLTDIRYDDRNLFPVSVEQTGGQHSQKTEVRFDDRFGTITASADPNGIDLTWTYDEFGRMRAHHGPEEDITVAYADDPYHVLDLPAVSIDSKYQVTTSRVTPTFEAIANGDKTVVEYNALGQPVRVQSKGLKDADVLQEFQYDNRHRLTTAYRPHLAGDTSQGYNSHDYDPLDRLISDSDANFKSTTYSYAVTQFATGDFVPRSGGTETTYVEDADGHLKSYAFNAAGGLFAVFEGGGQFSLATDIPNGTTYLYGAFDALIQIGVGMYGPPAPLILAYDDFGRVSSSIEPARGLGTAVNTYNAFDELVSRVDHAGRGKELFYDNYGRLDHTIDDDGGETHWYYDFDDLAEGPTDSIGRLVKTTSPSGQTVHYSYMGPEAGRNRGFLNRVTHELQAPAVDGSGTSTVNLTTDYNYDYLSRLERIDYPVIGAQRFSVEYGFDNSDHVISASNGNNSSEVYWQLVTPEQGVRIKQERLGSAPCGTTFGTATPGVVTQRSFDQHTGDLNQVQTACGTNVVQDVSYGHTDGHLTKTLDDAVGGLQGSFVYDALGRISTINNIQAYTYDAQNRGLGSQFGTSYGIQTDDGTYQYNAYWTASFGENTYLHDTAGDQHERSGPDVQGGSQIIDYTPFDLPKRVTQNGGYIVDFAYDADGERTVRARDTFGGTPSEVTYYDGDLYQRVDERDGSITNRNMIYAGGRLVAVATTSSDDTADPVIHYLHDDAIGSIQTMTSASGTRESTRVFNLFGVEQGGSAKFDQVPYGFTGQEHDTDLGLINMHGRVYDPVLGEFLTPDPTMPNPSGHGLNAFAYVENQPLDMVDPTGFNPDPFENDVFDGTIFRPATHIFGNDPLYGTAPATPTGNGLQSYFFDSTQDVTSAIDAADTAASVVGVASDIGIAASAAKAAIKFGKNLKKRVQLKPAPNTRSPTAFGGNGAQAPGRAGSNGTQTRTESPGSFPFGRAVSDGSDAMSAHDPQAAVVHKTFNAAAHLVIDTSPSLKRELLWGMAIGDLPQLGAGIGEYLAGRDLQAAVEALDEVAVEGLSKEALKSIRSLQERLVEHVNKLRDFVKNPDAFDNKGFLKGAPSQEVRDRIIQGRVKHLEQEIRNFAQQIGRLRGGGGK
jgi:RHS repeat-associated protein